MAVRNKKGHWKDATGEWVPPKYIDPLVKQRDRFVEKHRKKAEALAAKIEKWKAEIYDDIEKYFEAERERYGKDSSNPGQNKVFADFANAFRIEMYANRQIDFDDRIWIVQEKLFEYIDQGLQGSKEAEGIKVIVEQAYKTNKFGQLDRTRILGLRSLKDRIKHHLVKEAMDILDDCIKVMGSRVNIKFARKGDKNEWNHVNLDFSRM